MAVAEFISVKDAATTLGVSERLVYELTETGELPAIRIGQRRKVIPRLAIDQLVERAMDGFDPQTCLTALAERAAS